MRVKELKELLNNFSEDDYIIVESKKCHDHNIIEIKNVMRNGRLVAIKIEKDNAVEVGEYK
jgi:hypothetical protein